MIKMTCVTVHVSSLCIVEGRRESTKFCPIAIALKLMFPEEIISVYRDFTEIGRSRYFNPGRAKSFIKSFDSGYICPGFTFTMYKVCDYHD